MCLITDNNSLKLLALTFSENTKIGHANRIANLTLEGCFNEMLSMKCDAIVLVISNVLIYGMKHISIGNFQDSKRVLSRFRTNKFELRNMLVHDAP